MPDGMVIKDERDTRRVQGPLLLSNGLQATFYTDGSPPGECIGAEGDAGEAKGREYVGGVACQIGKISPVAFGLVVPMTITSTSRRLSG